MDYKEVSIWVQARELVKIVYVLTKSFLDDERFSLSSQVRRCAISVPSNIAEGCWRQTAKDTMHSLHIPRGSIYELETQLISACDLNYISSDINTVLVEIERIKKWLNGFINYHRKL
ncbi:MAG: four helix bundle protein [Flavobacteriaceae bacterium]